jgi:hypothetical protein
MCKIIFPGKCCLFILLCKFPFVAWAGPSAEVLEQIRPSVVKVQTPVSAATGFVWQDSKHVVTSLHVVDGHNNVTVQYINEDGQVTANSPARVVKVLKDADLVLLQLETPQNIEPLIIDTNAPEVKQTLDALGFPMNISAHTNTQVVVRFGGKKLKSILTKSALKKITVYPNVNLTILNLEGNLVPGLSGAPILNDAGHVVGIVDGGLENGAVGISWGIPANQLPLLAQSLDTKLPNAKHVAELFAADLDADMEDVETFGNVHMTKLRSRTFAQLMEASDDVLAVTQLATLFAFFNPYEFEYDIYQDLDSGATIVLPQGVEVSTGGNFSVASYDEPRMQIKFRVERVAGLADAQLKSQRFEQDLTEYDNHVQVMPDPQWSYWQPMTSNGVTVNRKAIYRNVYDGYSWVPDKYYFETLAFNGSTLLSVAAVNNDNSLATNQVEQQCSFTPLSSGCREYLASYKQWAKMVLGVQFSSFPAQLKD